jgi:hydroxypyruvate isomerase
MVDRRTLFQAAAVGAAQVALGTAAAEPAAPRRIKQSFVWGTFARGVPPEQLIREAAATGYASIEMGPREHWDRIRDAGMQIAIFVGHASLADGMNDRKNHDRIEKELLASIEVAGRYQIPSILCLSGNRRGKSDEEGIENTVACFRRVVKAAEEKKINLCLEVLNSKVDHPDYQADHTAWAVEVCRRAGSPAVRVLDDLYHMQIMEGDLIRTIQKHHEYIAHFHTAGNPGRRDLDETQEVYWPAVMRGIAATGYTGYVGHEFTPKGDPLEAMRKTFRLCDV